MHVARLRIVGVRGFYGDRSVGMMKPLTAFAR
jgi:hypothetical protein